MSSFAEMMKAQTYIKVSLMENKIPLIFKTQKQYSPVQEDDRMNYSGGGKLR